MVAYPDEHGVSGVMTFIDKHNGKVHERALGKHSTSVGAQRASIDPGWKAVAT